MKRIHGHEVMEMMLSTGKQYSRASLVEDIERAFGPEARFYTCSAENLTPGELIDFLEARGKFVDNEKGLQTSADRICSH